MESKAESQTEPSRKPSPVASLPKSSLSQEEDRELAEDIFGDEDSKPLAKVNPYNSAARISPNISQDRHGNFIQEQQKEEIQKAVQQSRATFQHNRNPGLILINQTSYPSKE
jgi:dethiobiotin synthetase